MLFDERPAYNGAVLNPQFYQPKYEILKPLKVGMQYYLILLASLWALLYV